MFRLPCKNQMPHKAPGLDKASIQLSMLSLLPLFFLSCAFADLSPIGINTVPEAPWTVLPNEDSHVIIFFDTDMEKLSAERAIQVLSPYGAADGKIKWEGRNLHFIPDIPWKPGLRYALKLSGTLIALDGREFTVSKDIPFFAISRASLPYVQSFFPLDGMAVAVSSPVILEINFSEPMDRRSSEDALKFEIPGEKILQWLDDDSTLLVNSNTPLNPWTAYRWSIAEKALSREGAPLAKEFSGRFITDLERAFITVVSVLPLMPPLPALPVTEFSDLWGAWLPAGLSLDPGPGYDHGIGVEFNKPADSESLKRAFSFYPSLPGRVEMLSPVSAVYIPSKNFESETVYEMRISGTLKDLEGLKMGNDYVTNFKTDIPFLKVNSISIVLGEEIISPVAGSLVSAPVITGGIIRCFINFSLPFDPTVREESAFKISLKPFFPLTLPPVSLRSARWVSSDRLFLEWEGPAGGENSETHFYRLLVPLTVNNGRGSYLKEDFFIYLEAENE